MTKRRVAAAAAMAVFLVGCGGESGPKLVPVTGTVTLNGKPLEGATVSFEPEASVEGGMPAQDKTGPDGNYRAFTKGRAGVMPGKYRVAITKSMLDPSKARAEFRDDPFMAQLSLGPNEGKTDEQRTREIIEGTFDREVPLEGGVQDFDVKRKSQ